MKLTLTGAVSALAIGIAATSAGAETVIKVATIAPDGTPWAAHLQNWEVAVEEASNGEIDLQLFLGGQLGNEFDVYKQVQRGRIDASFFSGAAMSENVPELALMSTPFLFEKSSTIDCIYDGPLGDKFAELAEAKGMKMAQWQETGWVYVYAKDDLSDVADAEGYKTRVAPQPMSRLLWDSVGANGAEIPYSETPSALQTNLVKGGESAGISYIAFGVSKVAPHFMKTAHMHQAGALMISEKAWGGLSEADQKLLVDSLPEVQGMRDGLRNITEAMLGKYAEASGTVHELTTEQRAAWVAKVEPNWPAFVEGLGGEAKTLWPQLLEAKAACGG